MTETARTATYIGVAIVLLVVAGFVNRKPSLETVDSRVGEKLFPKLESPDNVAGLEIVTADDAGGTDKFRVVRGPSGWTLPLHDNYPADAEKEVASAAASLIDLKALSVVATMPSEHAVYGVVDPEKASPGAEGVGKLVKVLDKSGNNLARLIVGKQDKQTSDAMDSQQELRFVRALPQDAVYRVAMPSAKFSTNFADWIETDLLKLDPWDITDVTLKDYTFDQVTDPLGRPVQQSYEQSSTLELAFNDKDSKWSLKKLVKFEDDKPQPVELAADEELNSVRLNEMKTALDDLKIVDVHPKPAGMSANLKANKTVFNDAEAIGSLRERGFYPILLTKDGDPEILSSDGEVLVTMKDGVEYTLRFGGVAGVGKKEDESDSDAKNQEKTDVKAKEEEKQGTTLNRFIMVSARFNPDLIAKPELESVPGAADAKTSDDKDESDSNTTKAPEAKTESSEPADRPDDQGEQKAKPGDDAAKKTDDAVPQPQDDDKSAAAGASQALQFVKLQDDTPAESSAKKNDDSSKAADSKDSAAKESEKKSEASRDDAKKDSAKPDEVKKSDEANPADAKTDQSKSDQEKAALERKRIEKDNEQKKKEYDEKITKGQEKAAELNARFAGWYYVVSEATYRKIHLNRDDVIKKKADTKKPGEGAAGTTDDADAAVSPLEIPPLKVDPLKVDPFQDRDDDKKNEEKNAIQKDANETNVEEKNDAAK